MATKLNIYRRALTTIEDGEAGCRSCGNVADARTIAKRALEHVEAQPMFASCGCKILIDLTNMAVSIAKPCSKRAHRDAHSGHVRVRRRKRRAA